MKKNKILYLAVFLVTAAVLVFGLKKLGFLGGKLLPVKKTGHIWDERVIGVYDRTKKIDMAQFKSLQHLSLTLNKRTDADNIEELFRRLEPEHPVLLTIETEGSSGNILEEVIEGDYDYQIKALGSAIADKGNAFYLRWNPEMEVSVNLFPWQNQAAVTYGKAFRHFSSVCKKIAPSARIIWGPAGYPGAEEYWPGADAVDMISVTINGKSELLTSNYPHDSNTARVIKRKIHRMRFMEKPVLVLGLPGGEADSVLSGYFKTAVREVEKEDATIYSLIDRHHDTGTSKTDSAPAPLMGVYDPEKLLISSPAVDVEHIFVDFSHLEDGSFQKTFNDVIARNHDVILTFEMLKNKTHGDSAVLQNVLDGVYDGDFRKLYNTISKVKQTVYLRFAHEMEIPIHRYPWQSQDPVLYIKAFRYFMNFDKKKAGNIKRVWGPAGDRGSLEWWPGDDVVDYISMAIYGLPDKNITDPNKQEMFSAIYRRKYHRMRFVNKPIFITEFGVLGPEEFQKRWLEDAASVIAAHKEIYGVCYFNMADSPKVWGNIPTPVWSISEATFNHFVQDLADKRQE
jgi:beta-mannanase